MIWCIGEYQEEEERKWDIKWVLEKYEFTNIITLLKSSYYEYILFAFIKKNNKYILS